MEKFFRYSFALLLSITTVVEIFPTFVAPPHAQAGVDFIVGNSDPLTVAANKAAVATAIQSGAIAGSAAATAGSTAAQVTQTLFEWAKSFVLSTLKRRILDVMVDQVVQWIQGGGQPRFITDWGAFFNDIGQGAVGEFVNQIGAGFLCEPFSLQIRIGLLPVQQFANNAPYACTLNKIVQNVQGFANDFRNGGWIAYSAASSPENNYYGALLIAWDARNSYVSDKISAAAANASANKGFLGTKRCYDTVTGAEVPESATANYTEQINPGDTRTGSYRTFSYPSNSNPRHPINCEDTTPGGVISATVEKAVGTDFDFIINAQQLGDYAAAIVNALVNRIIMEGVNGLRGVHSSSGGTYRPSGNSGTAYGGFQSVNNIPQDVRSGISNYSGASAGGAGSVSGLSRTKLIARITTALATLGDAAAKITAAQTLAQNYLSSAQDIVACYKTVPSIPGYGDWINSDTTAQRYVDLIETAAQTNTDAVNELTQALSQLDSLTDAQFAARAYDFQLVAIDSSPSIINTKVAQINFALQQVQTGIPPTLIPDILTHIQYCVDNGGTAPGGVGTPTHLTAARTSPTSAHLAWTAPLNSTVAGYHIERCQNANCNNFQEIAAVGLATNYDDAGLTANAFAYHYGIRIPYTYRIRAVDSSGTFGPYSRPAIAY